MRFVFGMIIGSLLTVGSAYVADTMVAAPGIDGRQARRMVDWALVGDNLGGVSTTARDLWNRLVGGAKTLDRSVKE